MGRLYTRNNENTGPYFNDTNVQVTWYNSASVDQVASDRADKIKLHVTVGTTPGGFYVVTAGGWAHYVYCNDFLTYGFDTVQIFPVSGTALVSNDYGYGVDVYVPAEWGGHTVNLNLCGKPAQITLEAHVPASPSTVNAGDGYFGSGIQISLTTYTTGVVHNVDVTCAGNTETLLTQSGATSVTWTPDIQTYALLLTTANSAAATITCTTYYSGAQVGTPQTKTITVSFTQNAIPPILTDPWITVTAYNGENSPLSGWIAGVSKARVTVDNTKVSAQYNAHITEYRLFANDAVYSLEPGSLSTAKTDIPIPAGRTVLSCSAIDSRGQWTAWSSPMTIDPVPYSAPAVINDGSIHAVQAYRCNAQGTADDGGDNIMVYAEATYTAITGNTLTLKVRVRKVGTDWSETWTQLTSGTASRLTNGNVGYSADDSWQVEFKAEDKVTSSASVYRDVPTQSWAMKFRPTGNGVAFGKAAEADKELQIPGDWKIRVGTQTILDLVYPVGSLYWSRNSTDPGTLFGGTWTRVKDVFILAAGDTYAQGATGGAATVTLTASQMPEHNHTISYHSGDPSIDVVSGYHTVGWGDVRDTTSVTAGGGQPHENMPPYKAYYCWERTA